MTAASVLPDDWRDLAAEYALGLLVGDEYRAARELESGHEDFRAEVARWRGRLSPMVDEVQEVAPPPSSWSRISAATTGRSADNDNVIELRGRVRRWQGLTAAATAIAAAFGVVALTSSLDRAPAVQPAAPSSPKPMVAMIGKDAQSTAVVASWDPGAQQLVLAVPGELPAAPNHAHELWVIPAGGKPRSLGTMPAGRQMHMKLAEALAALLENGATIAISVEPPGGSPTGSPTGPVIASGALQPA